MEMSVRIGCTETSECYAKKRTTSSSASVKKFQCAKCGPESTTYSSQSALCAHMLSHRVPTNFVCATCDKTFINRKFLQDHLRRSSCATKSNNRVIGKEVLSLVKETHRVQFKDGGFNAEEQSKPTALSNWPADKDIVSVKVDGMMCSTCCNYFPSYSSLSEHLSKCVYSGYEIYQIDEAVKETFKCQFCPTLLNSIKDRYDHLASHMSCKDCGKVKTTFRGIQDKRLHMKLLHGKSPCYACHLDFPSAFNLEKHMDESHPDEALPMAPMKQIVLEKVQKEMPLEAIEDLVLTAYPRIACEVDTKWRANLKQIANKAFLKSTTKNDGKIRYKPYNVKDSAFLGMCSNCAATFKDKFALECHCKSKICASAIKKPLQLELKLSRTKRSRKGKKKSSRIFQHLCSKCSAKFHFKVELRAHMRTNHQEKHACQHCHQSMATEGFLERHLEICSNKVHALIFSQDDDD